METTITSLLQAGHDIPLSKVADDRGRVTVLGKDHPGGSYVLRIWVTKSLAIPCGRFKKGKLVEFASGDHSYVGSAMGQGGLGCLAGRIAWHASRSRDRGDQPLRDLWLEECRRPGLGKSVVWKKAKLRWNVDHLLEEPSVRLVGVWAVRWPVLVERAVGRLLEDDPHTVLFETQLGSTAANSTLSCRCSTPAARFLAVR